MIITPEIAQELGLTPAQVIELNKLLAFINVKSVSELTSILNPIDGHLVFEGADGSLYKVPINTFYQLIGGLAKPISPSDPAPTVVGWYKPTIYSADPGTNYPNLTDLKAVEGFDTLFYFDGAVWVEIVNKMPQSKAFIPAFDSSVFPLSGEVQRTHNDSLWELEAGQTAAVTDIPGISSKWVKKISGESKYIYASGANKLDLSYAQNDKSIASNGNIGNTVGSISIIMLPLKSNTTYTLSGYLNNSSKYMAMKNAAGITVGSVITLNPAGSKTFTTPADPTFLNMQGKMVAEGATWDDTLMLNEGATALPYEPFKLDIVKINDHNVIANSLADNNYVPNPTNLKNAVNKEHFDINAVRVIDLTVSTSNNLAKPEYMVADQYINSAGAIASGAGWRMIVIPVSGLPDGQQITFGRFTINGGGYAAFRNATDNTLSEYLGAITGATKTVVKPAGATHLYIDIKRPADDGTNYAQLTVNLGPSLLPYESPLGTITKIKNYNIEGGGGQAYDQSLNTTDGVQFNTVTTNQFITGVIVANLPTDINLVDSGEVWVDLTNDNTLKRKP